MPFNNINELIIANTQSGNVLFTVNTEVKILSPILSVGCNQVILMAVKMCYEAIYSYDVYKVHNNGVLTAITPKYYFRGTDDLTEFIKHQLPIIAGKRKSLSLMCFVNCTMLDYSAGEIILN